MQLQQKLHLVLSTGIAQTPAAQEANHRSAGHVHIDHLRHIGGDVSQQLLEHPCAQTAAPTAGQHRDLGNVPGARLHHSVAHQLRVHERTDEF